MTLPLASHKQSFSIYHQSSPFRKVSAKVLLKWQLDVLYPWNPRLDHFRLTPGPTNEQGFKLTSNTFRQRKFP